MSVHRSGNHRAFVQPRFVRRTYALRRVPRGVKPTCAIQAFVLRGDHLVKMEMFMPDEPIVVGRHRDVGLRLLDRSISRHHLLVTLEGGRLFIQDLGATNGTFLNGARLLGRSEVTPGDRVELGAFVLKLRVATQTMSPRSSGSGVSDARTDVEEILHMAEAVGAAPPLRLVSGGRDHSVVEVEARSASATRSERVGALSQSSVHVVAREHVAASPNLAIVPSQPMFGKRRKGLAVDPVAKEEVAPSDIARSLLGPAGGSRAEPSPVQRGSTAIFAHLVTSSSQFSDSAKESDGEAPCLEPPTPPPATQPPKMLSDEETENDSRSGAAFSGVEITARDHSGCLLNVATLTRDGQEYILGHQTPEGNVAPFAAHRGLRLVRIRGHRLVDLVFPHDVLGNLVRKGETVKLHALACGRKYSCLRLVEGDVATVILGQGAVSYHIRFL